MSEHEDALQAQVRILVQETLNLRARMSQRWLSFLFDLLRDDIPLGRLLRLVNETEKAHETNTIKFVGANAGVIASAVSPLVGRLMAAPALQQAPTDGIPLERRVYHRMYPEGKQEEVRAVRIRLVGLDSDAYLVWGDSAWNNPSCMPAASFDALFAPGPTPATEDAP
jgi:hypothetical protein